MRMNIQCTFWWWTARNWYWIPKPQCETLDRPKWHRIMEFDVSDPFFSIPLIFLLFFVTFFFSVASILFKINLDYFMFPSITRWTLIHSVLSMVQSRFVKTGCINCILAVLGSCFYDLISTFEHYSGKSIFLRAVVLTWYFFSSFV